MATTIKGVVGGGLTISASPATVSVPTGYLVENESDYDYITETITIPNGIKVIEVHASASADYTDYPIVLSIRSDNKHWHSDDGDYYGISYNGYIGVTPNKQYTVNVSVSGRDVNGHIDSFYIRYSPEINNKTPTIKDY